MNTDAHILQLNPSDAQDLLNLIAGQSDEYLRYAPRFRSQSQALVESLRSHRLDRWWGFREHGAMIGFFMLRGFDEGYERPAFGVLIGESASKRGLATRAIQYALEWCRREEVPSVMLRVDPANSRSRQIYIREGFRETGSCPDTGQQIMEKFFRHVRTV